MISFQSFGLIVVMFVLVYCSVLKNKEILFIFVSVVKLSILFCDFDYMVPVDYV